MNEGMIKIRVDLPNHFATGGESMWATPVGPNRYRIENVPFYAYGLNYHDVVEAVEPAPDKKPEIVRLIEASGHRTLRVIFAIEPAEQEQYLDRLRDLGCELERANENYVAIDVPPEADYDDVFAQLSQWDPAEETYSFESCEARVEGSFDDSPNDEIVN